VHRRLNSAQRVICVIGVGVGLFLVGSWVTSLGQNANFGWVAYAPLSNSTLIPHPGGLHPWVRLVIWLVLTLLWAGVALALFKDSAGHVVDPRVNDEG
jgi:heme/copper-type cytochrome/quinol oxidase subunit 1